MPGGCLQERVAGEILSPAISHARKPSCGEVYGYDGAKKVIGKRFILVDTLGLLLAVIVTEANFPERLGGAAVVMEAADAAENLVVIWVDQGFDGPNFRRVIQQLCAASVNVICRTAPGFQVLPKRWIVERTFGWWNQYRRKSHGL